MKINNLLILLLSFCLSTSIVAEKAKVYKNSYNYKRAMELLNSDGDKNEALDFLQKEVAEHPKNGYAYYWIGSLYEDNDQLVDALEPTNKAIELLKKDKEWVTFAYRRRARINQMLGNEKEALNDWNMALKSNPKDVNTYYDRGEYYYWQGMYAEADADFDRICKIEPTNPLGYVGKGRNAIAQENYKDAVELLTYCLKLDSSYSQGYAFRAEAFMKQGMMNECIDDIIKALNIDGNEKAFVLMLEIEEPVINTLVSKLKIQQNQQPNEMEWSYYIGVVYEEQGRYQKAIDTYNIALKIEKSDVLYGRIANCYNELGYFELALENIIRAMELDPEDVDYVAKKADLLYDMGRGGEAIATFDDFIKLTPEYYAGYYRRGFMKDNLSDVDGAIEDYSMTIALKPDFAYAYLGRADMYVLKGDRISAINDYKMVVRLDTVPSDNSCAQYAYLALGEIEKAKSFQKAIIEQYDVPGNYYDAACLYARMGEKEASLEFLKIALKKGFRRFIHIKMDDDLIGVREMDSYIELMQEYEGMCEEELKEKREEIGASVKKEEEMSETPFRIESGNCYVKCKINDLPMQFVFDTGSSDVSLSMVEASFMLKNGYLSEKDVIGSVKFSDAVGNVSEGTVINLRKVKFGDVELDNVKASVVKNQKAPLLLGQTVLSRIGKIEIDNENKVLRLRYLKKVD
ncbi:MAG: tetratricopeptide repeat protein [Bacteroidaceae bacterium]|nr:tetratricopeptide repeat protein [Bacteroidaceae bacterium]